MKLAALLTCALLMVGAQPADAQLEAAARLSAGMLAAPLATHGSAYLDTDVRYSARYFRFGGALECACGGTPRADRRAGAEVSAFSPAWRGLRLEAAARYDGVALDSSWSSARTELRAGVLAAPFGVRTAARVGRSSFMLDSRWLHGTTMQLRLERAFGLPRVALDIHGASFVRRIDTMRDTVLQVAGFPFQSQYVEGTTFAYQHVDAEVSARVPFGRLDLEALAGTRHGIRGVGGEQWLRAAAAFAITPALALRAEAGRRPFSIAHISPATRSFWIGFQWRTANERLDETVPAPAPADHFVAAERIDGNVRMILAVPTAASVRIMGDFTDWTPVELTATGAGVWELHGTTVPGTYRVLMSIDHDVWFPPRGLPTTRDEFGGRVGVVVVP